VIDEVDVIVALSHEHGTRERLDPLLQGREKWFVRLTFGIARTPLEARVRVKPDNDRRGAAGDGPGERFPDPCRGRRRPFDDRFIASRGPARVAFRAVAAANQMNRGEHNAFVRPPHVLDEFPERLLGRLCDDREAPPTKGLR
jgi:hypothetical protein